jgi:hypothetical protein
LDLKSLGYFSQTCTQLYRLATDEFFWKQHYIKDFPEDINQNIKENESEGMKWHGSYLKKMDIANCWKNNKFYVKQFMTPSLMPITDMTALRFDEDVMVACTNSTMYFYMAGEVWMVSTFYRSNLIYRNVIS